MRVVDNYQDNQFASLDHKSSPSDGSVKKNLEVIHNSIQKPAQTPIKKGITSNELSGGRRSFLNKAIIAAHAVAFGATAQVAGAKLSTEVFLTSDTTTTTTSSSNYASACYEWNKE